jgi:DNA-binding NarL/FixJ family response regulator
MTPVDVLVIDDQTVFRDMLVEILEADRRYRVVGRYSEGLPALEAAARVRPRLAIVDVVLPDVHGIEVVRRLRALRPGPRVLVVTAYGRPAVVRGAFEAGAHGIVVKSVPLGQLRAAVEEVSSGGVFYCPETTSILHALGSGSTSKPAELSSRERDVLRLVASGRTSKEIADILGIRTKTVSNHRARLVEKLGIRDVAGLTRFAMEQGLIDPP